MPLIVAYGLGEKEFCEDRIWEIEEAITSAVTSIDELALTNKDISFSFPKDPSITSDMVDVVIIVELLFDKPERTFEIRQRLAREIANRFKELSGNENRIIEVAVKRFDPNKDGFARIDP